MGEASRNNSTKSRSEQFDRDAAAPISLEELESIKQDIVALRQQLSENQTLLRDIADVQTENITTLDRLLGRLLGLQTTTAATAVVESPWSKIAIMKSVSKADGFKFSTSRSLSHSVGLLRQAQSPTISEDDMVHRTPSQKHHVGPPHPAIGALVDETKKSSLSKLKFTSSDDQVKAPSARQRRSSVGDVPKMRSAAPSNHNAPEFAVNSDRVLDESDEECSNVTDDGKNARRSASMRTADSKASKTSSLEVASGDSVAHSLDETSKRRARSMFKSLADRIIADSRHSQSTVKGGETHGSDSRTSPVTEAKPFHKTTSEACDITDPTEDIDYLNMSFSGSMRGNNRSSGLFDASKIESSLQSIALEEKIKKFRERDQESYANRPPSARPLSILGSTSSNEFRKRANTDFNQVRPRSIAVSAISREYAFETGRGLGAASRMLIEESFNQIEMNNWMQSTHRITSSGKSPMAVAAAIPEVPPPEEPEKAAAPEVKVEVQPVPLKVDDRKDPERISEPRKKWRDTKLGSTIHKCSLMVKSNLMKSAMFHSGFELNAAANEATTYLEEVKFKRNGLHPFSSFAITWDFGMSVAYIYILWAIPIIIAFNMSAPNKSLVFSGIYIADILVNLITNRAIRDSRPFDELTPTLSIWQKQYLTSFTFVWDVVSAIPLSAIAPDDYEASLLLIHLVRMFNMITILKRSPVYNTIQHFLENQLNIGQTFSGIFGLGLFLFAFLHLQSCGLFLVGRLENFNNPSISSVDGATVFEQYTWALFQAVGNTFPLAYKPTTMAEQWTVVAFVFVGAVIYASIVGTISAFAIGMDASGRAFKQKMDELNDYMNWKQVCDETRKKVLKYYSIKYRGKLFEEGTLLGEMNESLRTEIAIHNCKTLITKVPFLLREENDGRDTMFLGRIATALVPTYYVTGDVIVQQGEIGSEMYFILSGKVNILVNGRKVAAFGDGAFFGEVALIANIPRTATVQAAMNCMMYRLTRSDFTSILSEFDDMRARIDRIYQERMERVRLEEEARKAAELLKAQEEESKVAEQNDTVEDTSEPPSEQ